MFNQNGISHEVRPFLLSSLLREFDEDRLFEIFLIAGTFWMSSLSERMCEPDSGKTMSMPGIHQITGKMESGQSIVFPRMGREGRRIDDGGKRGRRRKVGVFWIPSLSFM
jgi:hypothetical protein